MKVDIDVLNPTQRKVRVELPAETVDQELHRAYQSLSQRARIRGFRRGKAPRSVLERLYGDEVRGEVRARLVERSLGEVFKERGLEVISRPAIDADEFVEGKAWSFSALFEVKPEIEVKNYLGLELEKVRIAVGEGQVEAALGRLQEAHAHLEPVEDRASVERGDFVVLDFLGSIDGKPFPGGKGENYLLEVGRGNVVPQFEDAIVGLKKDGEHTISVAYPTDYSSQELAGKTAEFRVVIREIKRKVLPPLDDDFAKDHGDCASLEELRQKIRARLESELGEIQTRELKEQILTRLIEAYSFDVPGAMVNEQIQHLIERHQSRLAARGAGGSGPRPSPEELRKDLEPFALRQVKASLLMEKIAALEKIEVSEEELRRRIEEIVRSAKERGAALREIYLRDDVREDLRSQVVFERALDFLLQRSKVKEVEPPVAAEEKKG